MSAPHDPWKDVMASEDWGGVVLQYRTYDADAVDAARAADAERLKALEQKVSDLEFYSDAWKQEGLESDAEIARHQAEIDLLEQANAIIREEGVEARQIIQDRDIEIVRLRATVDQQQARIAELETDLMNQIDNSVALAHTVQAREARITELETALKDLLIAVTFAHTVEFTPENHCWEARVPVAFVEQARQALETP